MFICLERITTPLSFCQSLCHTPHHHTKHSTPRRPFTTLHDPPAHTQPTTARQGGNYTGFTCFYIPQGVCRWSWVQTRAGQQVKYHGVTQRNVSVFPRGEQVHYPLNLNLELTKSHLERFFFSNRSLWRHIKTVRKAFFLVVVFFFFFLNA